MDPIDFQQIQVKKWMMVRIERVSQPLDGKYYLLDLNGNVLATTFQKVQQ